MVEEFKEGETRRSSCRLVNNVPSEWYLEVWLTFQRPHIVGFDLTWAHLKLTYKGAAHVQASYFCNANAKAAVCFFVAALEVVNNVYAGKDEWQSLFKPSDFFQKYKWGFLPMSLLCVILVYLYFLCKLYLHVLRNKVLGINIKVWILCFQYAWKQWKLDFYCIPRYTGILCICHRYIVIGAETCCVRSAPWNCLPFFFQFRSYVSCTKI